MTSTTSASTTSTQVGSTSGLLEPVPDSTSTTVVLRSGEADSDAGFNSPSGNISCGFYAFDYQPLQVSCSLRAHDYQAPALPDCDLDYGDSLDLYAGEKVVWACHGDVVFFDFGRILPYGATLHRGVLSCTSMRTGMECRDKTTGHGFRLSRSSYDIF